MTSGQHASVGTEPEVTRGNLPPQLTPLLGREAELRELRSLTWGTRLLTLSGPGGAGKSRLAIALADALREDLVDGAWWVDLAASVDSGLVAQELVRAVLPGSPAPDPAAALARRFAAPALVVLDNCEAVRNGCAQVVAELLARASTVRIVATSRQPLGVVGEQVWRVGGLDVEGEPPIREGPDVAAAEPTGGAMTLFIQRAREADGAFDPDAAGTRDAVKAICRWLDGMPLAIELAAARVSVLGCEQIAERLRRDSGLLRHPNRAGPSRQRTLDGTLDWSYRLLAPAEQRLFRRLGAFRGGFSLAAAEAVCAGDGLTVDEILDLLSRLIDQSLVQTVERVDLPRYRLLSTFRQYALAKLTASDELDAVRARHASFFHRFGLEAQASLSGADQVRWLERLEREDDNLREALDTLFERHPARAAELAGALWPFAYQRGYYSEARSWFERVLSNEEAISAEARVDALLKAGEVAFLQCDYPVAVAHLQRAVALLGVAGDRSALATALQRLGSIAREQGRYDESRGLHERSMEIWETLGDDQAVAASRNYLGFAAWLSGDFAAAERHCAAALAEFRRAGDLRNIAATLISFGAAATYRGEAEQAAQRLSEALAISRRLGFQEGIAWSLNELAVLSRRRRRAAREAETMLRDALRVHHQLGDRWRITSVLEEIAGSALARTDAKLAVALLACADATREQLGTPLPPAEAPDRDAALDRLRRRLSADAFATAWSQGCATGLDEAIDDAILAIEGLDADDTPGAVPILTPRELAVLELLVQGHTNQEIAATLYISPSTAGVHVSNILRKLRAKRRVDAAGLAHQLGLLPNT